MLMGFIVPYLIAYSKTLYIHEKYSTYKVFKNNLSNKNNLATEYHKRYETNESSTGF